MAKKFQFRLEAVRDMRKRAQDEAARRVSVKGAELAVIEQRLDEFAEQLRDMVDCGRADRARNKLEIAALRTHQYHARWLHDQIADSNSARIQAESDLAEVRASLTQATAKVKAIEKLRERKWQRHSLLLRREEQAVNDEIAGRMSFGSSILDQGASG